MLLELDDFSVTVGRAALLRDIRLRLAAGDSLALVGESGSGKTSLGLALMRLLPAGAVISGHARLEGQDLLALDPASMRAMRGRRIAMVFQEPLTALDPLMRVGRQLAEAVGADPAPDSTAAELWRRVDLPEAGLRAFPHQLSGGQRQRAMIAIAIARTPALLIADEASTALDAATRLRMLALLDRLREATGMGLLLISHDLGLVSASAPNLAVMYGGRLVETGPTAPVLDRPAHPYTASLAACSMHLRAHPPGRELPSIAGQAPGPAETLPGCRFAPRCPRRRPPCEQGEPPLAAIGPGRAVACLYPL